MSLKKITTWAAAIILVAPLQSIGDEQNMSGLEQDKVAAADSNIVEDTTVAEPDESSGIEDSEVKEHLSTITIEGRYERQGTVSLQPGAGGSLDTAELLKRVPGANVNRNGALTNLPQYRGLAGNRINVSVDGVNLKEVGPNSMDTSLSNLPKAVVKSVKVYRGIAPVSSGIETLGGTIATESKKGEFADAGEIVTHGAASAGYSWVNAGRFTGLNASVANENNLLYFNGSYEKGNDYKFTDSRRVRPSNYERGTWGLGYGFQKDGHEVGIGYDYKDTSNAGTPSLPLDIVFIRSHVANANYSLGFDNGYELDFKGFFQTSTHQMDNFTLRPPPRPMGVPRFRFIDNELDSGGYRLMLTIPEIASGDLKLGVDGDLATHNALVQDPTNAGFFITAFSDAEINRYAAFVEWDGRFGDDWGLELGLRYNRIEMDAGNVGTSLPPPPAQLLATRFNSRSKKKTNNNVDGVVVLRYSASDSLDLELGVASKTRAPSYQQRYNWIPLETTGGLADGRVYVGDIDLDSERSYEAEFSLDWHTDRYYITPGVFYRYIDDFIQGVAVTDGPTLMVAGAIQPGGPGPLQFGNINAELWGSDVEMGLRLTEWMRVDGILSYVRGRRVGGTSDNLYRIAPLNGRVKMTLEHADWLGVFEFVGAAKQSSTAAFNGETSTAGYGLFNVRVQYQPHYSAVSGLTLAAGVDNIIDKQYADHLSGVNRAANVDLAGVTNPRVPSPGRNVYATLSYEW